MSATLWTTQRVLAAGSCLAIVAVVLAGCGGGQDAADATAQSGRFQVADDDDGPAPARARPAAGEPAATSPTQPPVGQPPVGQPPLAQPPVNPNAPAAPATGRAIQVPDGTPDELVAFIRQLELREPQGDDRETIIADARSILTAMTVAAGKLMSHADATEDQQLQAAHTHVGALSNLGQLGDRAAHEKLLAFAEQLAKAPAAELKRLGRLMKFSFHMGQLANGDVDDSQPLLAELKAMVGQEPAIGDVFAVTSQAAHLLEAIGEHAAAIEAFQVIGEKFSTSEDPQLAASAQNLLFRSRLVETQFEEKLNEVLQKKPGADEAFLALVGDLLTNEAPSEALFEAARQAGSMLEITGSPQAAKEVFELIGAAYAQAPDEELRENAAESAAKAIRRLGLVGRPMQLDGMSVAGRPFDWAAYRGKYVLVDFWATWCGPCLRELPLLVELHGKYKDKGFEIVGVNLDDQPQRLLDFLDQRPLPWTTIVSADPQKMGFDSPLAIDFGVEAIPFPILVDPEGVVIALHLRGPELEKKLAELFGEPAAEIGRQPIFRPQSSAPRRQRAAGLVNVAEAEFFAGQSFVHFVANEPADAASEPADAAPLIDESLNPYAPDDGLSPLELVDFIESLLDKPRSIQRRPGFADGVSLAADRVLAAQASDKLHTLAALAKLRVWHERASFGDAAAEQKLWAAAEALQNDPREKIAAEVRLVLLEKRLLEAEAGDADALGALLDEAHAYLKDRPLEEKHLRIASSTVKAINLLAEGPAREQRFAQFGELYAASSNKELARYGKKLLTKPEMGESDLVGRPLELAGVTALGVEFNWQAYRGKVVLVDFWATWCGPCRREMPEARLLHDQLKESGLEVVGVSLDKDLEALATFLNEHALPWENLCGEGVDELAKRYGVRGIPTYLVVDRDGKIAAVGHQVKALRPTIEKLLKDDAT